MRPTAGTLTARRNKIAGALICVAGLVGLVVERETPALAFVFAFIAFAGVMTVVRGRAWPP